MKGTRTFYAKDQDALMERMCRYIDTCGSVRKAYRNMSISRLSHNLWLSGDRRMNWATIQFISDRLKLMGF